MSYTCTDELEHFRFDDCQITEFRTSGQDVELIVEALIVKADNSQNTNYTESYAGTATIRMQGGRIVRCIRDGYRYYDANDVLVSEIPDYELSVPETAAFPKKCAGAYLIGMQPSLSDHTCELGIEFEDAEDHTIGDSYRVTVTCDHVVCTWERYLNRVQG